MRQWMRESGPVMESAQKPLELILARNLITSISTPAFLLDDHARLLFYNEAAGALLGRPFEETGRMSPEEWIGTFGPFDEDGQPAQLDELSTTQSVRQGRPLHSEFIVRSISGEQHRIEASAVPISASDEGSSGAMVFFWRLGDDE
jgi:PAS domain-containing protein